MGNAIVPDGDHCDFSGVDNRIYWNALFCKPPAFIFPVYRAARADCYRPHGNFPLDPLIGEIRKRVFVVQVWTNS